MSFVVCVAVAVVGSVAVDVVVAKVAVVVVVANVAVAVIVVAVVVSVGVDVVACCRDHSHLLWSLLLSSLQLLLLW